MSGIAPDQDQPADAGSDAAAAQPTAKPAWWKKIVQLYQQRPLFYGFFTLLGLTLLVAGLSPFFSSGDGLHPPLRQPETSATRLRSIADSLRRMDEFGQMPYAELLRDTLNPWMRQLKPPGAWEPDSHIFEIFPLLQLAAQRRQGLASAVAELQKKLSAKGPAVSKQPELEKERAALADLGNQLLTLDRDMKQLRAQLNQELSTLTFSLEDAFIIEGTAWMRDISSRVRERLAARSRGAVDNLALAQELFDWTVRNVAVDEKEEGTELLWESLLWGRGPSPTRAWIFIELCRQQGLDAVMLGYRDPKNSGNKVQVQFRYWIPAVVLSQGQAEELYLFDHKWGIPIPGPGGKGVATLTQAAQSPEILAQLDAVREYPVRANHLQEVVAMLDVSPHQVSRRMQVLEGELSGADRLVLTVELGRLAARLQKVKGVTRVKAWPWPFLCEANSRRVPPQVQLSRSALLAIEGVEEKGQKNETLKRDPQFRDLAFREPAPAPGENEKLLEIDQRAKRQQEVSGFLWRGRMLHFRGVFSDTDHQRQAGAREPSAAAGARKGAPNVYQSGRLTDGDLDELRLAMETDLKTLETKRAEAVKKGATEADLVDVDRNIAVIQDGLQRMPFVRLNRQFVRLLATAWVGQVAYERGDYADAAAYFRHLLDAEAPGLSKTLEGLSEKPSNEMARRLRQYADEVIKPTLAVSQAGANYNLARALEAAGRYPEAIEAYQNDNSADQRPGSVYRARRLEAAEAGAKPAKKTEQAKKTEPAKKTDTKQPVPAKPAEPSKPRDGKTAGS